MCACQSMTLKKLGYSSEDIDKIESLTPDHQNTFSHGYNGRLLTLLDVNGFDENNFEEYQKYFASFENDQLIVDLVNKQLINDTNLDKIISLSKEASFDINKLNDYLKYYDDFDINTLITLVNKDLLSNESVIDILKDPYFIYDNLNDYLDYQDEFKEVRLLVEYVNAKCHLTAYEDYEEADLSKGIQVLVNKYYYLGDYEPETVTIDPRYGFSGQLVPEAYEAFVKMFNDAQAQGIYFFINSPYRSFASQTRIYNSYLANDPQWLVDTYSARPGFSEHQLGLALDILSNGYDFGTFYASSAAAWLKDNAYKYGFILRYPADKVDITGYKYEPWHYRYVGDIAEDVYQKGITYDEYYAKYIK